MLRAFWLATIHFIWLAITWGNCLASYCVSGSAMMVKSCAALKPLSNRTKMGMRENSFCIMLAFPASSIAPVENSFGGLLRAGSDSLARESKRVGGLFPLVLVLLEGALPVWLDQLLPPGTNWYPRPRTVNKCRGRDG